MTQRVPSKRLQVLHVGCGHDPLPIWFEMANCNDEIVETRLDIDPESKPDILASMLDMGEIGPYDVVLSVHALEHVYPHEVHPALVEMRRVLRDGGYAQVCVPDLQGVEATDEPLYESPAGPVCGLDMIYGMRDLVAVNPHYAHHCGFTKSLLEDALRGAGFSRWAVRRADHFNLIGFALK